MFEFLYLASLVTYTFGALTFAVLTASYWKQRRAGGGAAFPAFTLICGVAFLANLLLQFAQLRQAPPVWTAALTRTLEWTAGLLPALLFHVVYARESRDLRPRRAWQLILAGGYAAGAGSAVARGFDLSMGAAPALMLGGCAALGIAAQRLSRRTTGSLEQRQNLWTLVVLILMAGSAALNLVQPGDFVGILPDYLVLAFFCITLYYQERLVFFDLLIKRGALFTLALAGLTLFFVIGPGLYGGFPDDWTRPWICALLLSPLWLAAPWIHGRVERAIDRAWLHRRYAPADAERRFVREVQLAASEEELSNRAARSLSEIFQAPAEARFQAAQDGTAGRFERGLFAAIEGNGSAMGWVGVAARPDAVPFLSDDFRLFQSLIQTLGVVLENVRFRQQRNSQEEREQQLRWLASRAELKALRAQINPHFLFNALNAIAGLIPGQPDLADETIQQLAEVFRYALRKPENEFVRLDEEMEFVTAYLRVEQARFGKRLQVELAIEPAASAILIPAMTVQPLVENAIKYGASLAADGGRVKVRAAVEGDGLRVDIFDNGPGFPQGFSIADSAPGHGLSNVIERLTGYYGIAARVRWDCDAAGAHVRLEVPAGTVRTPQAEPPGTVMAGGRR